MQNLTTFDYWLICNLIFSGILWFQLAKRQNELPEKYQDIKARRKLFGKILLAVMVFSAPTFAGCVEWNLPFPWPFHNIASIGSLAIMIPAFLLCYIFPDYLKKEQYKKTIYIYFASCFLFIFVGPIILGGAKFLWALTY